MAERTDVPSITFVGEQDGVPERVLKQALRTVLRRFRRVEKAYLARVLYPATQESGVALCIFGTDATAEIIDTCGGEFHRRFNTASHLDIMFLTAARDAEVRQVCEAFYVRDANSHPNE